MAANPYTIPIAWAYSRVSSESQYRSHLSLENQAAECLRYYDFKLAPRGVLIGGRDPNQFMFGDDAAVSSRVPLLRREAAIEMDRRLGKGDHIILPKIDRAWRSMRDAVSAIDYWKGRGIHVHFASECMCESSDPEWRTPSVKILLYAMTMCAEMERDRISERMKDMYAAKRARGEVVGNIPPLGMRRVGKQLVPDEYERSVLALVRHLIEVQKMPLERVMMLLWRAGVKLRNQNWQGKRSIDRILARAVEQDIVASLRYWDTAPNPQRVPPEQQALLEIEKRNGFGSC